MAHKNLLVDANNFVFSLRHTKLKPGGAKQKFVKEFLFLESLSSLIKHAKMLKADSIVICSDSAKVWRRDIYPDYKANHTGSIDDIYFSDTIDATNMLTWFLKNLTASYTLSHPRCEADDVIAVWCQESRNVENVILSTDKDFIQLIDERTTLYSPVQAVFRETEDAGFDLFVKCIRGDAGDNVRSSFPRVRMDRLKKAWDDDLEMLNLLETVRPDGVKVGDALSQNISLIDLSQQPDYIRDGILLEIESFVPNSFSLVKAMKFLGDNHLKERRDILDGSERIFRTAPVFRA